MIEILPTLSLPIKTACNKISGPYILHTIHEVDLSWGFNKKKVTKHQYSHQERLPGTGHVRTPNTNSISHPISICNASTLDQTLVWEVHQSVIYLNFLQEKIPCHTFTLLISIELMLWLTFDRVYYMGPSDWQIPVFQALRIQYIILKVSLEKRFKEYITHLENVLRTSHEPSYRINI